jgi:polar amino acid transport system substrate-binding protein
MCFAIFRTWPYVDPVFSQAAEAMEMKKATAWILLCVVLGAAHAEPFALVTGDDYAPFADQKLPEGGMTTEIVKRALSGSKVDFKIEWRPWARGLEETRIAIFAGTFPYLKTPEREKDFLYSQPIYTIEDRLFSKPGAGLDAANLKTLEGKKICLPIGWAPSAKLAPMIKSGAIRQEQPRDISTCVKMVQAGRADFFVTDQFQGNAALQGVGATDINMGSVAVGSATLHLIASKNGPQSKALIDAFDKGLAALKKSGEYERIVSKHANAN